MSQWTKGKSKQRNPPTLFSQPSATASNVSIAAADSGSGAAGGVGGGHGASNVGSSSPSGTSPVAATRVLAMQTLQRTTSRLRQEMSSGSGTGSVLSPMAGPSSGSGPTGLSVETGGGGSGSGGAASPGKATISGASATSATDATTAKTATTTKTARTGQTAAAAASPATVGRTAAAFTMPLPLHHQPSTRGTDRTDALWAEMQATLEEVELSASEGTRVFGPDHDQKLAALRQAQIALAQAWARSEADEGGGGELSANNLLRVATTTATSNSGLAGKNDEEASASGLKGDEGSTGPGGDGGDRVTRLGGRPPEEETQVDILLARKRREANDRYFQRVRQGVLDVVAKLDDVADAMRAVEQESVDIWGGGGGGAGAEESEPPASAA